MNERYQIQTHGLNHSKPYYIAKYILTGISKENGFWQQISPQYFRKGNALRYATKHHITLENN